MKQEAVLQRMKKKTVKNIAKLTDTPTKLYILT